MGTIKTINPQLLEDIADAIRAKNGDTTAQYTPAQMANAILTLPSGGTTIIDEADWNAMSTAEKKTYGLVIIQTATTGYQRGIYVNGADYNEEAVRIWTKSTGGNDAAMYVQKGYWDDANNQFVGTESAVSVLYTSVQSGNSFDCYGLATLSYSSNWRLYASTTVNDGVSTYHSGDLIRQWRYDLSVDMCYILGEHQYEPATGALLPYSDVTKIMCEADLNNFNPSMLSWGKGSSPMHLSANVDVYAQDSNAVYIPTQANGTLAYVDLGAEDKAFTAYVVMKLINPSTYTREVCAMAQRSAGYGMLLYGSNINVASWANDTPTGVSSSADYFVGCIRFNPNGSPTGYGKVNNTSGITKPPTHAGQYVTIGRTDIDSSTSNAEPANSLVKFVGVVGEAESDSVIQQNMAYLMNEFGIS